MANISKIRLSGQTYDIQDASAVHDLSNYYTTAQTDSQITAATAALAETISEAGYQNATQVGNAITAVTDPINSTLTAHTANTNIHVTSSEKSAWNAKAELSDIPSVSGYADAVQYNSTTHYVEFYHGGTSGTKVFEYDASPFLVDGMVESVVVTSITSGGSEVEVLEITWNSAAGGQVTDIPLTDIFNPSDYYTTAQTQSYVSGYTYDKQTIDEKVASGGTFDPTQYYDKNDVDGLLANKANTATTYTKTEVDNAITAATSTKQDTLVSGTNIKTVGGTSLLGSGNVGVLKASIGTGVDAETLILTVE